MMILERVDFEIEQARIRIARVIHRRLFFANRSRAQQARRNRERELKIKATKGMLGSKANG